MIAHVLNFFSMPTRPALRFDTSAFFLPGGSTQELAYAYQESLEAAREHLRKNPIKAPLGWMSAPSDQKMVKRIQGVVRAAASFETLLVLGIGGSDLGARTLLEALPAKMHVVFAGDNTDPDELEETLSSLNWKKTVINIVSKSGDTIEPMSAFFIARERLQKAVGKNFAKQIVATTDAMRGSLRSLAVKEGYHLLLVPSNVGGRFSVLTDVGLFPAAWAGVDIKKLLEGARAQQQAFERLPITKQLPAQYAMIHAEQLLKYGRSLFVLMPYSNKLRAFSRWYRQLVAESLGKAQTRRGTQIEFGPTPIAALGATDQHSQIQLYMEGPRDKVHTFIEIEAFKHARLRLPKLAKEQGPMYGLSKRPLQDIIHAERAATAEALHLAGRPNGTIFLPKLDAYHLGELMQFFMLATAYLGELFDINAFDQPGVEEGKRRFWDKLKK